MVFSNMVFTLEINPSKSLINIFKYICSIMSHWQQLIHVANAAADIALHLPPPHNNWHIPSPYTPGVASKGLQLKI